MLWSLQQRVHAVSTRAKFEISLLPSIDEGRCAGADAGNSWRTSPDISATWASVMANLDSVIGLGMHAGPGHWNDPDMLEVPAPPARPHVIFRHTLSNCLLRKACVRPRIGAQARTQRKATQGMRFAAGQGATELCGLQQQQAMLLLRQYALSARSHQRPPGLRGIFGYLARRCNA